MRIGALNRRIALQRGVETPSGTGGTTIDWQPIGDVWANIRYLNGIETSKGQFPISVARASIRIRLRQDIDATCRAVHVSNGITTVFEILAVLPDAESREYLDMAVQTGANNG